MLSMMTKMMMMHKNRYILIVTSIVLAYEEATFVSINYSTTGRSFISIYLLIYKKHCCVPFPFGDAKNENDETKLFLSHFKTLLIRLTWLI